MRRKAKTERQKGHWKKRRWKQKLSGKDERVKTETEAKSRKAKKPRGECSAVERPREDQKET